MRNLRDEYKTKLVELFKKPNWENDLDNMAYAAGSKVELLWAAADLAKEGYVHEVIKIARHYQFDPDPSLDDECNKDVIKGEEYRAIVSVRGTLCWLLQNIVATLETSYYGEILDMLEGTESDTNDRKKLRLATGENLYVRQQATIPLDLLVANMLATKNKDGTPFNFGEENRIRTEALAFRMLKENKNYPRVLEYLANVFSRIRNLDEAKAEHVLNTFFYKSRGALNPDYLVEHVAALAIYYAEFRETAGLSGNFNSGWFKSFLKQLIRDSSPRLNGSFIWLFWKTLKDDISVFPKFKVYIPLFFEPPYQGEIIHQIEFLIETIFDKYQDDAIELLEKMLDYVQIILSKEKDKTNIWLSFDAVVQKIAEKEPEKLIDLVNKVAIIWKRGGFIGDLNVIFKSYEKAPKEKQVKLKNQLQGIYKELASIKPDIIRIDW